MFNIAFPELIVIATVALIFIGPEKLPKLIRGLGIIIGRFQKQVNEIKSELQIEDLKQLNKELESHKQGLNKALREGVLPAETVLKNTEHYKEALKDPVTVNEQQINESNPNINSEQPTEDLKKLYDELESHKLGLNNELRDGILSVETVLENTEHYKEKLRDSVTAYEQQVNEIKSERQTEDLKKLHDELESHKLGLNNELRDGILPVETVLENTEHYKEKLRDSVTAYEQQVNEIKSERQTEDLKKLHDELESHKLGLNNELRDGILPVETVLENTEHYKEKLKDSVTAYEQQVNEIKSERQTEDLKKLHDELESHKLGLNNELRDGILPVETVLENTEHYKEKLKDSVTAYVKQINDAKEANSERSLPH